MVPSNAWVRSDFILLERILLNLVSNAIRYTDRGGVTVGCRRRGRVLRIEVWDSGIGIPEDQRKNVFGEFYQLADPERSRRGGLGLGLAIVDRLCRLLDHRIEVTSTLDGKTVKNEERLNMGRRMRDVVQANDGAILAVTDDKNGELLRLTPSGPATRR